MSQATGGARNMYSKSEEEVPQWETMIDGEHNYAHLAVPTA